MDPFLKKAIRYGIIPREGTVGVLTPENIDRLASVMARDAEPMAPNNSIPWHLLNIFNPEIYRTILTPLEARNIAPAVKRGDWAMQWTQFIRSGIAGDVSSYGDFSHDATVDVNFEFPPYEQYRFQSHLRLGDLQQAQWGLAKINLLSEFEVNMAEIFNRTHNRLWFFGVNGINNWGILTDPNLPATIQPNPAPPVSGTGTVTQWEDDPAGDKSALGIFNDVRKLRKQLTIQSGGYIKDAYGPGAVHQPYRCAVRY